MLHVEEKKNFLLKCVYDLDNEIELQVFLNLPFQLVWIIGSYLKVDIFTGLTFSFVSSSNILTCIRIQINLNHSSTSSSSSSSSFFLSFLLSLSLTVWCGWHTRQLAAYVWSVIHWRQQFVGDDVWSNCNTHTQKRFASI